MSIEKLDAVSRIAGFETLPIAVRQRIADASGLQRIGRKSTIFREGDRPHFVYGLVEGRVALLTGRDADETIAEFLDAGHVALIAPALLDLPYMATGRATTDVLALLIPAVEFRRLAESELSVAIAINRMLARHWRLLLKHLKHTKSRDADTRVVQYLLDNVPANSGPAVVTLPSSRRQLAAHLGITPETLSRSFKRLTQSGVHSNGARIAIDSIGTLAALTGHRPTQGKKSAMSDNDRQIDV